MSLCLTKRELREIYKEKRKALSKDEVLLYSEQIFEHFISFFKPKAGDRIHLFLGIEKLKEITTFPFIEYCHEKKIRIFVPKIVGDRLISVEIFPSTDFAVNSWGITEPVDSLDSGILNYDFVITPLLYCDCFGNRVGYGKGFYDTFFKTIQKDVKKIGVNFFNPDEKITDVWENDIPLNYLVTPTEVLSFLGLE